MIVSDTLRRDHLGCYGYAEGTSPNIDAFAADSAVFVNAFAQAPSTKPAVASIFTSTYPSQHRVLYNEEGLSDSFTTLAEVLKANGYATGGFIENATIDAEHNFQQGFDTWERHERFGRSTNDMDERIAAWLTTHEQIPFFLYVHFIDPHSPYGAPDAFRAPREPPTRTPDAGGTRDPPSPDASARVQGYIRAYDEEIRFVDARVGSILEKLGALGIRDDTVVMFLADHGEGFMEHGSLLHSYGAYAELIDIPLIIHAPPVLPAGRYELPTQQIDLFPTVLGLLGIPSASLALEGRNILRALGGEPGVAVDSVVISEQLRHDWPPQGTRKVRPQRALIKGRWKLLHDMQSDSYALFDRGTDPIDAVNVLDDSTASVAEAMRTELMRRVEALQPLGSPERTVLGPQKRAALEQLGYLGSREPDGGGPVVTIRRVSRGPGPILTPASDGSLGDNLNGPSVIQVPSWVERPLGRYYLYFAHHLGSVIRLAYADDLRGPWRVHSPGTLRLEQVPMFTGHIASPDVHVDHERRQIRMYFHGPVATGAGQRTGVAVSRDGLHFRALEATMGAEYMRVFRHRGMYYAVDRWGRLSRSNDPYGEFEVREGVFIPSVRHAAVLVRSNTLVVFYSRVGDAPERILMSTATLDDEWNAWELSDPVEVLRPQHPYEGVRHPITASKRRAATQVHQLRDPAVYTEQGRHYLFYSIAGESGIAMAEVELDFP